MTYNAANRKHVREAEKALLADATIDREVIVGLMSVMNGRAWIHKQLAEAYVFRDPFSPDPTVHAYNAGLRSAGIRLFNSLITFAPDNFTLMIREEYERAAAADARRDTKRDAVAGDDNDDAYRDPFGGYPEADGRSQPTQ